MKINRMSVSAKVCDELAATYKRAGDDSKRNCVGGSGQISTGWASGGGGQLGFGVAGERRGKVVKVGGKRKFVASQGAYIIHEKNRLTDDEVMTLEQQKAEFFAKGGKVRRYG